MRVLRVITGFVFLLSGIIKVSDLAGFAHSIDGFALLPRFLLIPAALCITGLEAGCGMCLITGIARSVAATCLGVLTLIFSVAIAINLLRENLVPCGCFGLFAMEIIGPSMLLRDILLCAWMLLLACKS